MANKQKISSKKKKILEFLKQNPEGGTATHKNAKPQAASKSQKRKKFKDKRPKREREPESEPELSDEDVQFFDKYSDSSSFLNDLDTKQISAPTTKQGVKKMKKKQIKITEDAKTEMESLPRTADWEEAYQEQELDRGHDRLPYKAPDGSIQHRTKENILPKLPKQPQQHQTQNSATMQDDAILEQNTPSEQSNNKKKNKDASALRSKANGRSVDIPELNELKDYQRIQETVEQKKGEIALFAQAILTSPETNIDKLQKLFMLCHDPQSPEVIHDIALLSIAAVFKDILPGYKIVLHNQEDVKLSKEKKRLFDYESQLLVTYQDFLGLLEKKSKEGGAGTRRLIAKSAVTLLNSHPHFNFRTTLINIIVPLAGGSVRGKVSTYSSIALKGIEELFANDITSGQATLETVRRIATFGKQREYRINPDILKTFLALKLSEDVGEINPFAPQPKDDDDENRKPQTAKEKLRDKKQFINKKEKKRLKKEREIEQQMMTATGTVNKTIVVKTQREVLRSVFATYFRVIKQAPLSPVLSTVLEGLAQYSHLISVDFLSDVINVLLEICSNDQKDRPFNQLQCCLAVFKTMKSHGEALNVDLKDFYEILYSLFPFVVSTSEQACWLPLINVLTMMVTSDRKAVALDRIAAFAKRISILAMHVPPHFSYSLLYVIRTVLAKFPKVRQLLSSEHTYAAGTYNPMIDQPDHSGPFATSLWELALLMQHYHTVVAKDAATISTDDPGNFVVKHRMVEYLFHAYDPSSGGFNPPIPAPKKHRYDRKSTDKKAQKESSYIRPVTGHKEDLLQLPATKNLAGATFVKYFKDLRKYDQQKELFRLKQILARYKIYHSKKIAKK